MLRVEAFERRWPSSAVAARRDGSASSPRTARRRSGGCSPARTRRCARRAGRSSSQLGDAPSLELRVDELRALAPGSELVELLDRRPAVESLIDLSGFAVKSDDDYEQARTAVEQAALNELAARDRALLEELFRRSSVPTRRRRTASRRSTSRISSSAPATCCASNDAIREREQLRFRQVCVDEFQDTNRLQCEVIDLISPATSSSSSGTSSSRSTASATPTSTSSRSGASPSASVLPLTENWRSRPEVLAVVNQLFAATFGDEFQRLVAAGRFPDPASGPAVELLVTDKSTLQGHRRARGGEARRRRSRGA